jgi:signal recognition particle subunit SRP54
MEQLAVLGRDAEIDTLPIVAGQLPPQIAKRAIEAARLGGYDVVLLDTAGRTTLDEEMMNEAAEVKRAADPHEVLLVADSLTGQDAVNLARAFDERVGLTGIVLTRVDGDGRGGAALSMRAVTNKPIKLIGVGEKLEDLDDFHPERIDSRILGRGDIVSLVEKAAETIDAEEADKLAKKMAKGQFDMNDLRTQLNQMRRMGGLGALAGMIPGMKKAQAAMAQSGMDDKILIRMDAILSSMTTKERAKPEILSAKRKIRVANGSGTTVQDVNRVLKMHQEMSTAMKRLKKMGGLKGMMAMLGKGGPSGGLGGLGNAMGGPELGDMLEKTGGSLPGLGGPGAPKLPPGFQNFMKKK